METVIYRKSTDGRWANAPGSGGRETSSEPESIRDARPLAPELFYPLVRVQEMVTWTHWLPTMLTFDRPTGASPADVVRALTKLEAPPEVLEELHWSWKMGLFETYEVRTPVRRDFRDPVLLGRLGQQRYRIALWGESLRPLEEITTLVQHSLVLKARAAQRRGWFVLGGALLGLGFGVWTGSQPSFEGEPLGTGLVFALLGVFFAWLPTFLYTPENRQHDFLDRYRS